MYTTSSPEGSRSERKRLSLYNNNYRPHLFHVYKDCIWLHANRVLHDWHMRLPVCELLSPPEFRAERYFDALYYSFVARQSEVKLTLILLCCTVISYTDGNPCKCRKHFLEYWCYWYSQMWEVDVIVSNAHYWRKDHIFNGPILTETSR